jgi:cysteine synthase
VAKGMNEGTIVTVLPDRGEKYLTTNLFDKP